MNGDKCFDFKCKFQHRSGAKRVGLLCKSNDSCFNSACKVRTCKHAHVHACACANPHIRTRARIFTYAHTNMHTHTHTHTQYNHPSGGQRSGLTKGLTTRTAHMCTANVIHRPFVYTRACTHARNHTAYAPHTTAHSTTATHANLHTRIRHNRPLQIGRPVSQHDLQVRPPIWQQARGPAACATHDHGH